MSDRELAQRLIDELGLAAPELLRIGDVDLRPAAEQHVFLRLRAAETGESVSRSANGALGALAASASTVARWGASLRFLRSLPDRFTARPGTGLLLVQAPVHCRIWAPIADALEARGVAPLAIVRVTRFPSGACGKSPELAAFLGPRRAVSLLRADLQRAGGLRRVAAAWRAALPPGEADTLRASMLRSLGRITALAHELDALVQRLRPSIMVTFAELNEWARVITAVGRARDIPTLDLPHAEAVDPAALAGLAYDRIGVFGPTAAAVLRAAGYPPDRTVQIGAPHFDELIRAEHTPPPASRRLLFTSQFIGGRMTREVKMRTLRAALAAAGAVMPSELVIRRHPVERDSVIDEVLGEPGPPGLQVSLAQDDSLRTALDGAWLLVTGWSNTVFEAAIRGTPSLTINATGGPSPMPFAAEGMSVEAFDETSAADAARRFGDEAFRQSVLQRAIARLGEHLGPLDGQSAERAAELVIETAVGRLPLLRG